MKGFKTTAVVLMLFTLPVLAKDSYRSVLSRWTRNEQVFSVNNLETRLDWHATYLSPEFRAARREKLKELYEWSDSEMKAAEKKDEEEAAKYDDFFLGIYAGSSAIPEVGRTPSEWRLLLEVPGQEPIVALEFIPVTAGQVDRVLYPYLNKWTRGYRVRFPKMIKEGELFHLRFPGIPAKSDLVWK